MIGRGHNNCDGNSDHKKKDDTNTWENTPAVKIVGQMGYDAEIIAKGVQKVLNDWCKDLTASKLLDAIYEIEEAPVDDSKEEQLPHANHTDNNVDRLCEVMQNDVHIGQLSNKNKESLIQNGISTSESGASNRSTVYSTSVLNHREHYVERNNPENPVPNKNKSSESKSDNFTLTKLKPVADNYEPTSKGSANNEIVTLLEENKKLKQSKSCKICLENEVNILFLPCRHLACCESCADSVKLCPLCRHAIVATVKTYLG